MHPTKINNKEATMDEQTDSPTLAERECQVLKLYAEGITRKEIGSRLFISENTVKSHLLRIKEKLNASTSRESISIAIRKGLI